MVLLRRLTRIEQCILGAREELSEKDAIVF
jgi:hypothetical protein